MRVTVQFRGPIAVRMENPVFQVDSEDKSTLRAVLVKLLEREEDVMRVWSSPERIDKEALVLCNEVDITLTGGLDTELVDGDHVVVLPLVHGG